MAAHCLLVTPLPLTNLRQNTHGTYRRLRMLAQAVRASGASLTVATIVPPDTEQSIVAALPAHVEADLKEVWGIDATVRVARCGPPSRLPWLAQQLRGVLGYGQGPGMRQMASAELKALLRSEVGAKSSQFIVAHRLASMSVVMRFVARGALIYFDMDDVEHIFVLRSLRTTTSLRNRLFGVLALPALLYAEWRALRNAQQSFVCSTRDARHLSSFFRTRTVQVLPNAVPIPRAADAPPAGQTLLMVGVYAYGPNADAAEFFINDIFPLVRQRYPQAQLLLAGAGADGLASYGKAPPNVQFLGYVDDLAALYEAARIVVCPVRYGGGTRVKLVEAAAWGKAIVTTTLGAEGLGMRPDHDALFADRAREFADACARLMRDDALCATLGRNARQLAREQFDQERIIARLAGQFPGSVAAP